jgi:hypothetical protein
MWREKTDFDSNIEFLKYHIDGLYRTLVDQRAESRG